MQIKAALLREFELHADGTGKKREIERNKSKDYDVSGARFESRRYCSISLGRNFHRPGKFLATRSPRLIRVWIVRGVTPKRSAKSRTEYAALSGSPLSARMVSSKGYLAGLAVGYPWFTLG